MKEFKYKINGSPYRVVVNKSDEEIVELEVNGTPFTVELQPKTKKPKAVVQRHTAEPVQTAPATLLQDHQVPPAKTLFNHLYRELSLIYAARWVTL